MKTFKITIDFESWHTIIEANTKEEAEQKALDNYSKLIGLGEKPKCWIGDCEEE